MISIRKISFLVIIAALSLTPAFSEGKARVYGFSVSPLLGFMYGHSEEIVYKYPGNDIYLSELLWDIKPLFYAGLAINFGPRDPFANSGFFTDASLKAGLPIKTGIMEDRDWQYTDNNNLTNYSLHDAVSHGSFLTDISAGFTWHISRFFALGACVEFSYMYHSWSAFDGYRQYLDSNAGIIIPGQTWNDQIPKIKFEGEVIKYAQNWFIVSPGLSLKGKLSRFFSLEGSFNYSPLIYCADRDDHLKRTYEVDGVQKHTVFTEYIKFGNFFDGRGKLCFSPKSNIAISLSFGYRYITGSRGDAYINGVKDIWNDTAGVGYSTIDAGLALKYTF